MIKEDITVIQQYNEQEKQNTLNMKCPDMKWGHCKQIFMAAG